MGENAETCHTDQHPNQPWAASTKDPPLFPFLLSLRLTRNINEKRQGDKDLALSALVIQMGWFTPLLDSSAFVNIFGSLSCSLSKPLLEKIWPFIYLGSSLTAAGASWKTQTWVPHKHWTQRREGPLLPANQPRGKEGREENSRQRVGERQVVDEAVAQRKNCNTRERRRASYDFAANKNLKALSLALFLQLEKSRERKQ